MTITNIQALPTSPFEGTGIIGIVITSGVPSYFKLSGTDLNNITSVRWFPKNPASVIFETRQLILVNNTEGTFMVRVIDNLLDNSNRGGILSFTFDNGDTLSYVTETYGPVSIGPLWSAPG